MCKRNSYNTASGNLFKRFLKANKGQPRVILVAVSGSIAIMQAHAVVYQAQGLVRAPEQRAVAGDASPLADIQRAVGGGLHKPLVQRADAAAYGRHKLFNGRNRIYVLAQTPLAIDNNCLDMRRYDMWMGAGVDFPDLTYLVFHACMLVGPVGRLQTYAAPIGRDGPDAGATLAPGLGDDQDGDGFSLHMLVTA